MQVQIKDLRLSLVWAATMLNILRDPQPESKLIFLGRRFPYEEAFTAAAPPAMGPQGLERPWRVPPGQPFWSHYLEGRQLPKVTPTMAWRALVPFRKLLPVRGRSGWWDFRMVFHGFFYPQGIALVVDVTSKVPLGLEEAVELALRLRTGEEIDLERDGAVRCASLEEIAGDLLAELGELYLGQAADIDELLDPFTVFTPVKAEADPDVVPFEDDELHKALEGVTTWNVHWKKTPPTSQEDAALPIPNAPRSHVLYGTKRGRAVWFPYDFVSTERPAQKLSTFHRDLVLTSMQVDSLAGFLKATDGYPLGSLQSVHRDSARVAAGLLGRLYGETGPFELSSPRYQMKQNDYVDVTNRLRTYFNMSELHPPKT